MSKGLGLHKLAEIIIEHKTNISPYCVKHKYKTNFPHRQKVATSPGFCGCSLKLVTGCGLILNGAQLNNFRAKDVLCNCVGCLEYAMGEIIERIDLLQKKKAIQSK